MKKLREILAKHSGRDVTGQVSIRHRGGRHKRYFRIIDWKRDKDAVPARVVTVEFDPNRSANISLLNYADGEKRYILAPVGLTVGSTIISGGNIDPKIGNCLQLKNIPIGTMVHSVEIKPGRGAKMIRSAGVGAMVLSKDENSVHLKLPSGEIRSFSLQCKATVGQIGNVEWKNRVIGKAGRNRHLGKRPEVRGVAQDPRSHPHGGGEGRSGIGMKSPKSPWGKRTLGKKTRKKKKYSDKFIIQKKK